MASIIGLVFLLKIPVDLAPGLLLPGCPVAGEPRPSSDRVPESPALLSSKCTPRRSGCTVNVVNICYARLEGG